MRGLGTLVNLVAVATGGGLGVLIGDRLPERMRHTIMQGLGLATIAVAVTGFGPLYDTEAGLRRFVILIAAVITGGLIGEALRLEERLELLGRRIRDRFGVAEIPARRISAITPGSSKDSSSPRPSSASGRSRSWGRSRTASGTGRASSSSSQHSTVSPRWAWHRCSDQACFCRL